MRSTSCLWALLAFGCVPSSPDLTGEWDTPQGLELTLGSNGRFSMGGKSKGEDFAGTWKLSGKTLSLQTITLRGKPVDVQLSRQLATTSPSASLKQRAEAVATLRKNLDLSLKANEAGTELVWTSNGQATTFSRVANVPSAMTDAQIAAGLRKGMPVHEVMAFFRVSESMGSDLPKDPTRSVSEFQINPGLGDQTVRVTYLRTKGKVGLESVEVVEGTRRRRVAIH